jgi:SAM-dependent methyltransferase
VPEQIRPLDAAAIELFAAKGREGGPGVPQAGQANAVKVRRVMQLTADLAPRPFPELRILDLGCGEGVYAIEAALRGASVLAVDARRQRMSAGVDCAARHRLDNVTFTQEDVRSVTAATHGQFDVVFCLGILYHLDTPDVFTFVENLRALCAGLVVVDTLIANNGEIEVSHDGHVYEGQRVREHEDDDSLETRRQRVLKSIDNTFSVRLTRRSLTRLLHDVGFTTVLECHEPPEPLKADDRVTLVARAGDRVSISTYPWINDKSEHEIAQLLRDFGSGR